MEQQPIEPEQPHGPEDKSPVATVERELSPQTLNRRQPLSLYATPIQLATVAFLAAGYAAFFSFLSLRRYWAYQMHALDMGNMGQAAWNTIHGHPFYFTNMRLPYAIEAWNTTTRLSFHVEPIFPLLSLVYFIYPHPESLLVLQTLALAVGAIPVYLIGRDYLRNGWLALIFALTYLLFPTLEAMNLYEFHPVAFATPLLLLAFLFLERRRWIPCVVCSALAMFTKEEIGLIVAMFGIYALVTTRNRWGAVLVGVGVIWSALAVAVVEKHYRRPGTVTYTHTRYGYLFDHGGVVHTILHDPTVFASVIFIWPKLVFLERLLAPVGYLALLAPGALALGLPTFVLDLFSQDFHMYSALGDNAAELVSVVIIAAILGAALVLGLLRRWLPSPYAALILAIYLLAQALWSQHVNGFTPMGDAYQLPSISAHQRLEDRFVNMIPANVPVSTQDQLDPHLSGRHYLYLFPDTGASGSGRYAVPPLAAASVVLLDVSAPTYPLPSYQVEGYARQLLHHGWGVAAASDGLILIENHGGSSHIPDSFYSYDDASSVHVTHLLRSRAGDLEVLGYDRADTDLPNHPVPNLAYTFYFRPVHRLTTALQPILYETMNGRLMGCARSPLGLAWQPMTKWKVGRSYSVRMDPLETSWNVPGTAQLWMQLIPENHDPARDCGSFWQSHGHLDAVGTLDVQF